MTTFNSGLEENLARWEQRRDLWRTDLEQKLSDLQRRGISQLPGDLDREVADFKHFVGRCDDLASEVKRGQLPANFKGGLNKRGGANTGAFASPLEFDTEQLRRAYDRLQAGETVRLEARDFATASPYIPSGLASWVTSPRHEGRILDRLPGYALEVPTISVVQINSVEGSAGIVAEGELKPEIKPVSSVINITAKKIAAHVGLSTEMLSDFGTFCTAVRVELVKQIIELENQQLLYGDGSDDQLNGFFTADGILEADGTGQQPLDVVEQAITALRAGPSLANADLIVLHPLTWSIIKRTKSEFGSYLIAPDPTKDSADSLWGVPVLTTTAVKEQDALILDTTLFGRAMVREALTVRVGWANDDFTRNILRTVAETRLNLAIERPSAVLHLTGIEVNHIPFGYVPPPKGGK